MKQKNIYSKEIMKYFLKPKNVGVMKNYDRTYYYGKGDKVIIEGDEYDNAYFDKGPKFLHYHATSAIITSLEFEPGSFVCFSA